jgi:cytochrome c5
LAPQEDMALSSCIARIDMKIAAIALMVMCLAACVGSDVPTAVSSGDATEQQQPVDAGQLDARTTQMWARSCALCHVDGNGGAPRVGNSDEWGSRLVQGETALLDHTLEGLNGMPPLGYCMACERDDFVAMINFMTAGVDAVLTEYSP